MSIRFSDLRRLGPALALAALGLVMFNAFGSSVQGYINTRSATAWWTLQWVNKASESEHGLLLLPLALWLFWRGVRTGGRPQADGKPAADERPPLALIGLTAAGLGLLFWAGMAEGLPTLWKVHLGNSVLTVALLGLLLVAYRREADEGRLSPPAVRTALASAGLGLLLLLAGYGGQQTRVVLLGILSYTGGVLALAGGRRWFLAGLAPAFLLLFAFPLDKLTDYVGVPLRIMVTTTAEHFATLVGIDVLRNGSQLVSADGRFQYDVAPACSGIRSLLALSAMSFIVGYFSFRSVWRRGLLLGLALPYAFVGNVVRICSIILAGHWFGQDAGSLVHDYSGFVIFLAVVGLSLVTVSLLQRFLPERAPAAADPADAGADAVAPDAVPGWRVWGSVAAVAVLAVAIAGLAWRIDNRKLDGLTGVWMSTNNIDPVPLPVSLDFEWLGYPAEVTAVEREVLPADTGFSRRVYENLKRQRVFVSIVQSGADRSSIHQAELCLEGQGWTIQGREVYEFNVPVLRDGKLPVQLLRIENKVRRPNGETEVVPALFAYWFVGGDRVLPSNRQRVLLDFWDRLTRFRGSRWAYVFVQTEARDGEAAALARLEEVINLALPKFQKAGRVDLAEGQPRP